MIENLDDTKVFKYFEEISRIPRGSGNNREISSYLVKFAKEHNLRYMQDSCENVIIWKDATEGYKNKPAVILQGHMDMVCEKEVHSKHDFLKEPLQLQVEGDFIFAKDTTLGGDDGIAIAYALAILDDEALEHPPLEIVITTDEETGMDGAIGLDAKVLKGSYMINIDSEEEGILLTSCAGGMSVNGQFHGMTKEKQGTFLEISLSGLQGGHSGTEIHKNRENATLLLSRVLSALVEENICFSFSSIEGGQKDNVIPREARAIIFAEESKKAKKSLEEMANVITKEVKEREPNITIKINERESKHEIFNHDFTRTLMGFFAQTPNGVQKMSQEISGLVESSLNLGICKTIDQGVHLSYSLRSSKQSYKEYMRYQICSLVKTMGGVFSQKGEYPAWEYRADSKLRNIMIDVYKKQYGQFPKIEAIHAGLECGILAGKKEDLDIVSIGPDIFDIHTPKERMSITSVKRVYKYLIQVLKEL
ncbi:MAG: aminoacyl-histidine dipeptidase [Lachnospiraceae bacterium]|nr:aminoacyl-histidine dipeptidase [Lachnospiraceae bacterium]